jgi:hypothetical protein
LNICSPRWHQKENGTKKETEMKTQPTRLCVWLGLFLACSLAGNVLAGHEGISGVEGQAVISPNVQINGTIIGGSPVQTHVSVMSAKGRLVTSFVTHEDGTFKVSLRPGKYLLVPDSPSNPFWQPVRTTVDVNNKNFTTVTIGYYETPQ